MFDPYELLDQKPQPIGIHQLPNLVDILVLAQP
jgi:hypothetical protein